MKTVQSTAILAGVVLLSIILAPGWATSAAELLQEANYAEQIEGNLDKAIELYDQLIQARTNRSYLAQAMYLKAGCLVKKQDQAGACILLERLMAEFADQPAIVEKAKALLEDLSVVDLARLIPAGSLAYIELGNPGVQIEAILGMVKGTPLDIDLAAIPQGPIAGLLNPSIVAELKKVKGIAVGITAVGSGMPSLLVLIEPGKSDAIRGVLALMGTTGKQLESVQGMQIIGIQQSFLMAYDQRMIILANSPDQVRWAIRQYKGGAAGPCVADTGSFVRLTGQQRQANALTVWVNIDQIYPLLVKELSPDTRPLSGELRAVETLLDPANIDDLIIQLALARGSIALEVQANLRPSHQCLVYNLFRTPALDRSAFQFVPANAIGLAGIALSGPNRGPGPGVSEGLKAVTGLDMARELCTNIEQVMLFAGPPDDLPSPTDPHTAILSGLCLCLVSHDPAQTRGILSVLGRLASLIDDSQDGPSSTASVAGSGVEMIVISKRKGLSCYVGQVGKVTVLSPNKRLVESVLHADPSGQSLLSAQGPLTKAVKATPHSASKVLYLNIGVLARCLLRFLESDGMPHPSGESNLIEQLAQVCKDTTVQFQTIEDPQTLNLRVTLEDLPAFGQLVQIVEKIRKTTGSDMSGQQIKLADLCRTSQAPVIDGMAEQAWQGVKAYGLDCRQYQMPSGQNDCSAFFSGTWDANNLYLFVKVLDDELNNDSDQFWQDDCVEIFIGPCNHRASTYQAGECHYHFDWDKSKPTMGAAHGSAEGVRYAFSANADGGYQLEVAIPWQTLGLRPQPGISIGLEVHVNDDDGGGDRDTKIMWNDRSDEAWRNPRRFGNGHLLICKPDKKE